MPPINGASHRSRSPSFSSTASDGELYYSNDDVAILYEIVSHGDDLLPTLPERDRLPTTALFRALDEILPRYGLDPIDDNKFAPIIFRIGGKRGMATLRDRFLSVIREMGIDIEFTDVVRDGDDETSSETELLGASPAKPAPVFDDISDSDYTTETPAVNEPPPVAPPIPGPLYTDDDTTETEGFDEPPPKSDPAAMARLADQMFLRSALGVPRAPTASTSTATVPTAPTAYKDRPDEDEMMRRAGRTYDIWLLWNSFFHWKRRAAEEAERTAIARRHLLRWKFFGAWRDQNIRDHQKATRFTLKNAFATWFNAATSTAMSMIHAVRTYNHTAKETAAQDWIHAHQEQKANELCDRRIKENAFRAWQHGLQTIAQQEADLRSYQDEQERAIKTRAAYDWMLLQRSRLMDQYYEEELKRKAFNTLRDAFRDQTAAHAEMEAQARVLEKQDVLLEYQEAAEDEAEIRFEQLQAAEDFEAFHLASQTTEAFNDGLEKHAEMARLADRGAYYCATFNALTWWKKHAKQTRRERLTTTYHKFRRNFKRQIARNCIDVWRAATEEVQRSNWEADEILAENTNREMVDTLNYWITGVNEHIVKNDTAVEMDAEEQLSTWRLKLDDHLVAANEADDYYIYEKQRRCLGKWETQHVQARSRQHTAASLAEKNNKTTCRGVLNLWRQASNVAPPLPEPQYHPRSSIRSRSSVRPGNSIRRYGYATPLRPMTESFGSSALQPIDERRSLRSRLPQLAPAPPLSEYDESDADEQQLPYRHRVIDTPTRRVAASSRRGRYGYSSTTPAAPPPRVSFMGVDEEDE